MSGGNSSEGRKKKANSNGLPKLHWINYSLTSSDKEWLASADVSALDSQSAIDDLVLAGFKYSLAPDTRNACFVATLTDRDETSTFYNHCLTGRGATPATARISLLYRHLVLAEGDWGFFRSASPADGDIYL